MIRQTPPIFNLPTELYDYCIKSLESLRFYNQKLWLVIKSDHGVLWPYFLSFVRPDI